ncbi:eukaryotic translation elongation factor 1 epsilon-1-like [Hydractinia symbiolongicarpus]|uniref:eukaryotic translation elongation factor 1 epsilon-1-like n=1 Tax=Hydractinia symbiolongicarpus TaxID=13093 RepID=UPI00254B3BE9|nr:eukaryotic translation elongation factor 1 epsilon-1-like [Hydractinia symbiolongicarpus]
MATHVVYLNGTKNLDNLLGFLKVNSSLVKFDKKKNVGLNEGPVYFVDDIKISGHNTVAKTLVNLSDHKFLLGQNEFEQAEVDQWLDFCQCNLTGGDSLQTKSICKNLNAYLSDKTYFVNDTLTLADIMMCSYLRKEMVSLTCAEREELINLTRWYNQMQSLPGLLQKSKPILIQRTLLY